eukprot:12497678-Alexandrium_andersonii.AAC.1
MGSWLPRATRATVRGLAMLLGSTFTVRAWPTSLAATLATCRFAEMASSCLLYTSDAADDM